FSSRRRHTRFSRDWSSDVCSSDLLGQRVWPAASSASTVPPDSPRLEIFFRFFVPLASSFKKRPVGKMFPSRPVDAKSHQATTLRSEERRVGKERRHRAATHAGGGS